MSVRDSLKVALLVLLPLNTWLGVFLYLHWQREAALRQARVISHQEATAVRFAYFQKRFNVLEGQKLQYPWPYPTRLIGVSPPIGKGVPVLFLNIGWMAIPEVWSPIIDELLRSASSLHLVLLYYQSPYNIETMWRKIAHPRVSILVGDWISTVFGNELGGMLLIFCDGEGVVRAIESFPVLKHSPSWDEEIKDWRPKLHRAVKKVLNEFFPKQSQ